MNATSCTASFDEHIRLARLVGLLKFLWDAASFDVNVDVYWIVKKYSKALALVWWSRLEWIRVDGLTCPVRPFVAISRSGKCSLLLMGTLFVLSDDVFRLATACTQTFNSFDIGNIRCLR